MPREVLTPSQVDYAERGVVAGETIAELARDLGVNYGTLYQRLCRTRKVMPIRRKDSYHFRLVFGATCQGCGERIDAAQEGENGSAFPTWSRLAEAHAQERHGVTPEHVGAWVTALWGRSGSREEHPIP